MYACRKAWNVDVKHEDVEYGVIPEGERFRWIIYPKTEAGPKVVSPESYATWDETEKACKTEIESGLRGKNA